MYSDHRCIPAADLSGPLRKSVFSCNYTDRSVSKVVNALLSPLEAVKEKCDVTTQYNRSGHCCRKGERSARGGEHQARTHPEYDKGNGKFPCCSRGLFRIQRSTCGGLLDPQIREQIALFTAQQNHCDYCLSAHTAIGKMAGLKPEQIIETRKGHGDAVRTTAALSFAKQVLEKRGQISVADLDDVRAAGFSDGEIAEIIAHVALNVLTNYFNVATDVEIDFPKVSFAEIA